MNQTMAIYSDEFRINTLKTLLILLKDMGKHYIGGSPAWVLNQAAWGHINSIYHLETETCFDKQTLGVKQDETQ